MAALRYLSMARGVAGAHRLLRDEDPKYQFEVVMLLGGVTGSATVARECNAQLMLIARLVSLEGLREAAIQFRVRLAVRRHEVARRRNALGRMLLQPLSRPVDVAEVRADLDFLLSSARRRRAAPDEVEALLLKASFHLAERNLAVARDAVGEAVSRAEQTDIKKDILRASVLAGQIASEQGDTVTAIAHFRAAEKLASDNRCFSRYRNLARRGLRAPALSRITAERGGASTE
jgi:hypothetical protein